MPDKAAAGRVINVPVKGGAVRYLRIVAEPFVPIPAKYPAEGNPAWIFVDEIIMN